MMDNKDPWNWTYDKQSVVAPLGAQLKPAEAGPTGVVPGDPVTRQLESMALNKGIDATAKGIEAGYKASTMAPLAATPEAAVSTYGLGAGAATGAGSQAAMLAAQDAALAGTAGTAASAAGTGAAMAGGEAALAAMGPVGWAIGAGLLAKKLGIF